MNRVFSILLCLCGAVVCAFLAYVGYKQDQSDQQIAVEFPSHSCEELLNEIPNDLSKFSLTEFQPGKHFVSYDDDENGQWEQVWVPMFPASLKKLNRNYRAVIVSFVDTPDKESLHKKLTSKKIDSEYWFTSQTLDTRSYNRLAAKYSSLDFNRSILIYSGYPDSQISLGTYLFWGGAGGSILSLLFIGWQSMSLVIAGIRSESEDDEDDDIINRAGLPTKENRNEYDA